MTTETPAAITIKGPSTGLEWAIHHALAATYSGHAAILSNAQVGLLVDEITRLRAENAELKKSGAILLKEKHKAQKEAKLWFGKAQEWGAQRDELQRKLDEAVKDTARLDYLDECNQRLNAHYGTNYGWELIQNHNVNRLMLGYLEVDLNDVGVGKASLPSCRAAIDQRMRERNSIRGEV